MSEKISEKNKKDETSNDQTDKYYRIFDLNKIVVVITNFYSMLYDSLQLKRMNQRQSLFNGFSWIDLLSESETNQSLRKELVEILAAYDLDEDCLEQLQNIRRERNRLCHPKIEIEEVNSILDSRWQDSNEYAILKKILKLFVKN